MKKHLKNLLFGFLSWLIPFIASIFFFTKEGGLTVDIFLFKSIMIVFGSVIGAILMVLYFKNIQKDYLREGIIIGMVWFAINIILDLLVLLPMSGMSVADYFAQIGIRYLVIPVMSIMVGTVLTNKN